MTFRSRCVRNELLIGMLKAGAMVGGITFLILLFFMYANGRYDVSWLWRAVWLRAIVHKVRREPAVDVAQRVVIGDEDVWFIPTSGHRAAPQLRP